MKRESRVKVTALNRTAPAWGWLLLAVIVIAALLALPSCAPAAAAAPAVTGLAGEVTVSQAAELRDAGAFVLDVRQPDEWNTFHIPDSTLIPLDQLEARLSDVPRDQDIVVVCRSGNRSAAGRDILLKAGYENVTSLAGGVTEWQAQGLPTVAGP